MPVVVRDNSIGQALGTLASGLMTDPKDQWEAYAFKQRVAGMQADQTKTELEAENLRRQQAAQDGVIGQFDTMLRPENFNVPDTVEAPRPDTPGFQGPMPGMHNPQYDTLENKLNFARASATNAIMRGGSPSDALKATYAALGYSDVLVNGVPTDPAQAQQAQFLMKGELPDVRIPLTETDRVKMAEEAQQAKLKENVSVPDKGFVLLSPEQGQSMGVQPDANGQYIVRNQPAAAPGGVGGAGVFGGEGWQQQASNVLIQYSSLVRTGQPVPPELEMAARIAWEDLYGTKIEIRTGPDGSTLRVPVQQSAPEGILRPGGNVAPGPSPGPSSAPIPAQPTVSGTVAAPVSGAPVVAPPPGSNGVQVLVQGTPKAETEAVQRKRQFVSTMRTNKDGMLSVLDAGYVPNLWDKVATTGAGQSDGTVTTALTSGLWNQTLDPQAQLFDTYSRGFLNAVLRDESGAAVPEQEYPRYLAALIPQAGDTPERIAAKRQLMEAAIAAREQGFGLRDIHNLINPAGGFVAVDKNGNPLPDTEPGGTATPVPAANGTVAAPAAGGTATAPDTNAIVAQLQAIGYEKAVVFAREKISARPDDKAYAEQIKALLRQAFPGGK